MAWKAKRVDVWAASIKDRPGSLAEKLSALRKAGADLEFVIARRSPERRGWGVVFLTPLRGARQLRAARAAGFKKTASLHSVRVEGRDRPGEGGRLTAMLAKAGINLRGLSGAAFGKTFICHLAFDTAAGASKALKVLKAAK